MKTITLPPDPYDPATQLGCSDWIKSQDMKPVDSTIVYLKPSKPGNPSSSRRAVFPRADKHHLEETNYLLLPGPGESFEFCTRHHDAQKDRAAVRAEIEILRRERLAYEQEGMETCQALARSKAHCRALEARVTVLETEARRHERQRQAADDLAVQHIMRTQALEAGARIDTLEDTGSSS
ncbi:hypothetical protein Tco_0143929 [Tanacetum coccineum]